MNGGDGRSDPVGQGRVGPSDPSDFERRAARYDEEARVAAPGYGLLHELTAALLASRLTGGARLLVVGAGTGMELTLLGAADPSWTLVGVDPSPAMLARAEARVRQRGLESRVDLVTGTVDALGPSPPFDAATLLLVLHFVPDDGAKLALLRGIATRLKPGAPLVLADLHGEPGSGGFEAMFAGWRRVLLRAGAGADDVEAGLTSARAAVHFLSEARLRELLDEAGFTTPLRFWSALLFGGWICERRSTDPAPAAPGWAGRARTPAMRIDTAATAV